MVIPHSKPARPDGIPVDAYSYAMMSQFSSNPVLFRIKYVNRDQIETTRGSNTVLGEAVHYGLKAFLGGCPEYPVPNDDGEALKIALDATIAHLDKIPDGYIDFKKNIPDRQALNEAALLSIPRYIREWDRTVIKEMLIVEEKLQESVNVTVGNKKIELPVPLVGYCDLVYEDTAGRVQIVDHKTVHSYTNPDDIDGGKLMQAAIYYLLVYSKTGRAPHSMTFREFKVSENKDGSPRTREYVIEYANMPIVFDLFFRFYSDMTRALLGEQVYVPNIFALFDRDVALMAYIYRLDEPDELEKKRKRMRVDDIATIMQRQLARSRNVKKFLEAKANLFTSNISINYATMSTNDRIRTKLLEHGVPLTFVDRIEGLSVELYRFSPTVGVKMSTLEKYHKDIEQILGVSGVRVLAPIPDTEYVGFEVPKKKRGFVSLSEARKSASFEIPFGVDVYGQRFDVDIRQAPHILTAGTTGSGKSVWLQTVLTSLARLPQHEVSFVLLDPKMVELSAFENDKHTAAYKEDPLEILGELERYVGEMQSRYETFKKHKVRSLEQYREKVAKDLPYVVIVVDEFADLIVGGHVHEKTVDTGVYLSGPRKGETKTKTEKTDISAEIKKCMIMLAQKARAAGIHLIITTQSPRAKVVDGTIKANFPLRVAFRTVSRLESEIILDRSGAELLLGKGDMLVVGAGANMVRLQGYNID